MAALPPDTSGYLEPPADVVALVDAPPTPMVSVSPDRQRLIQLHYTVLPGLDEVAEPFHRLAGLRIQPRTSTQRRLYSYTGLTFQELSDGATRPVALPDGQIISVSWSPDGRHVALTRIGDAGLELWVIDVATATARPLLPGRPLCDTLTRATRWLPGSVGLVVALVPADRGPEPKPPRVPPGPIVQETRGREAQNRTYQDLLTNAWDEALFAHYGTSQLARVTLDGDLTLLGEPCLARAALPSPDGAHLLVSALREPFSYAVPYQLFGRTLEVWSLQDGAREATIHDRGPAEEVPIEGVVEGVRRTSWWPHRGATLVWAEALDGGDPRREVEHRDRYMALDAPFDGEPRELLRVAERLAEVQWLETPGQALISDYDRDRRWITTDLYDLDAEGATPRRIFDRSIRDQYNDPGRVVSRILPSGRAVAEVSEGAIFLKGSGATPDGDRPFLDRLELGSGETTRLFESGAEALTSFVGFEAGEPGERAMVLRRESPASPPNYVRAVGDEERALTAFADPHPQLTGIQKRLLSYTREDGVPLSGMLYLPVGYEPGEPLPLVIAAYPLEYNDPSTAGQVRAAPNRFTRLQGTSPLMFLTQGYAVLDRATMPIVGDPETMNDTFVEQITMSAQAAIDAVVAEGVADRERVGVMGHSYGAFMVAHLLAWTRLFRAGLARSGAYNRSLTPFGFQGERRTLWEARDTYIKLSPLFHADLIQDPLLLIHGEVDNNSGTYPIQSKRLFHALQGLGGTARLVLLPHESHGYRARESVLHVLAESFAWFDAYVKYAAPRSE